MNGFIKAGLTAFIAIYCHQANAQLKTLPNFTKEGIIADYRLAVDILKKQHPNPYKFIDSITLDRKVDSLMKLAAAQSVASAVVQFSPIQLFRDVHTNIKFSEENNKEVLGNVNYFPFPVFIEKDKLLVNIKGEQIPYAAELVSINGQKTKDIIASLSASSYSDGFITTGTDRIYGNFQMVMSMRFPNSKEYEISYMDPATKATKTIRLAALPATAGYYTTTQAVMPVNQLARAYLVYGSFDDGNKTGTLTVNTFNVQEAFAYKEFSDFFREVNKRGYKNVIIDIRNNGGGNPAISALLFSFMAAQSFQNVYNYRTRNVQISYPEYAVAEGMRKMSEEDIRNYVNFLYQRFDKDNAAGFYIGNARLKEGQLENFPPDKDAFKGNIYVLTGGGTVSAATYFASLVQKNKRGAIIGKETGSGENVTTAAWFLYYLLPNTRSVLTVPMSELYFFNSTTDSGKGLLPDKEVPADKFMNYLKATQDPEWAYTMELIKAAQ